MFKSFFPTPKIFVLSALAWTLICGIVWYWHGESISAAIGLPQSSHASDIGDVSYFWSNNSLWFYIYYTIATLIFYAFWRWYEPHPWLNWAILGTAFLVFVTQFSVDTSLALNNWRGSFYNLIQKALTGETKGTVPASDLYLGTKDFVEIAFVYIAVAVVNSFFVSHWIFRWRTAMNNYFTEYWKQLRKVEGAAQRVQEDTMRFASTMQDLFLSAIDSVLTLVAFLPVLYKLSTSVTELPIFGKIPAPLVVAAIAWSLFGTVLLMVAGFKLPGLNFNNQKVEAALRKELVYGEDDEVRADPPTLARLFGAVRDNYFKLYFHYSYFNVARFFYGQADVVFSLMLLVPTIAAGAITFGVYQQIRSAFSQVANSFQYLANSWTTVVELMSIHKRLRQFESVIDLHAEPQTAKT
jgi:peptide/bleomycin uptake transporter